MDLDLGLTEEKPENRLGSKIGATAASGVTIAVIRSTLLVIRVPVELEVKEVHSQPIFHFRGSVKVKKKPVVEEKPVVIKKPVVEGWVWRRRTSWVGGARAGQDPQKTHPPRLAKTLNPHNIFGFRFSF
ncbi:uncharacterized protein LOC133880110 [Alnus glutinosa]|uniref:uncharacterized protein LOC133880110 n=1 Tax=Alnus glutinosa TaxID=3517 RepID=UPI002D798B07|nr:uncharacterized protein LOC133880110 [Alnus glutinosa]